MSRESGGLGRVGRYALLAAAGVAVVAVVVHQRGTAPAPSPTDAPAAQQAPDVHAMVQGLEGKLRTNPNDAEGWRMLGLSYFNLNRFPDAARAYARATSLQPRNADLWSALGEALVYTQRNGVSTDAAHAFERAVALNPKDPRARYFLGVRKDLSGDHRGAIDDWIALLKDTPAGAPWEQSVRTLVGQVATREKIDIAGRLPPPAPAAATGFGGGTATATDAIPGPSSAQLADAARLTPTQQDAMAHEMVDRLAAKLAADPHDAAGWIRLMRARMVLGDKPAAAKAYADARRAFAGDTATLAELDKARTALSVPG